MLAIISREQVQPRRDGDDEVRRNTGRRELIFRAALDVFSQRGFHQASMDEIAKAAGVGKGTIYLYVADKESLLLEAIKHEISVHERHIQQEVNKKEKAIDQLREIVTLEYRFMLTNVDLARLLIAERTALGFSPAFKRAMATLRRQRKRLVVTIMKKGQIDGCLRSDVGAEKLAITFMGINGGLVFDILFDDGPRLDPTEAAATFLRLFLDGAATS